MNVKAGKIVKINNNSSVGSEKIGIYYGVVIHLFNNIVTVLKISKNPIDFGKKKDVSKEKTKFYGNEKIEGFLDFRFIHSMDISRIDDVIGEIKPEFFELVEKGYIEYLGSQCEDYNDVKIFLNYMLDIMYFNCPDFVIEKMKSVISECVENNNIEFDLEKGGITEKSLFCPGQIYLTNYDIGCKGNEIKKIRFGIIISNDPETRTISIVPISSKSDDNEFHLNLSDEKLWRNEYSETVVKGQVFPEQIKLFDYGRTIKFVGHLKHEYRIKLLCDIHAVNFIYSPKEFILTRRNNLKREQYEKKVNAFFKGLRLKDDYKNIIKWKNNMFDDMWKCMIREEIEQ